MSAAESPIAEVQHQPAQVEQFTVTAPDGRIIISATRLHGDRSIDPGVIGGHPDWAIGIPTLPETWFGSLVLRNSSPDVAERAIGRLAVLLGAEPVGGAR